MTTDKKWQHLTTEQSGRVLTVRFDSGQKLNTFTAELMRELTDFARSLEGETELAAVILTGRPDIFTGGADLKSVLKPQAADPGLSARRQAAQMGPRMCDAWERIEPLTIVAIEGWCVGAGFALAVACDLRVMGEGATLYVPEIERGITMSWHSIPRTVALAGPAKTKRLIALAEKAPAQRALQWGIADEIVPDGGALDKAREMAERAAALPPVPLRMSKQAINAAAHALAGAVSYMDADQMMLTMTSEDFTEARDAFLEKRPPTYTGR